MGCCCNIDNNSDYSTLLVEANKHNKKNNKDTLDSYNNDSSIIDYELTNSCFATKANMSLDNYSQTPTKIKIDNSGNDSLQENCKLRIIEVISNPSISPNDSNCVSNSSCLNLKNLPKMPHKRPFSSNNHQFQANICSKSIPKRRVEQSTKINIPRFACSSMDLEQTSKPQIL